MRGIRLVCTGMALLFIMALSASVALADITIDIDPDTLNLGSKGKWITCYIDGKGPDPNTITSVVITEIDGSSPAIAADKLEWWDIDGNEDVDATDGLMAKFDRDSVQAAIDALALTLPADVVIKVTVDGENDTDTIRAIGTY